MNAGRRRRILILTPREPYPLLGGDRLRIYGLARELARHYDLTLLTFCRTARRRNVLPLYEGVFRDVHRVVLPRWRSCLNVLAAFPTREPLQVAYYRSSQFREAVAALAPGHDVVIAHLVRTAAYTRGLPIVRVLEMTDAISMTMQRTARKALGFFDVRRFAYAVDARRLAAYERKIAEEFDLVTLTSPVDETFLFGESGPRRSELLIVPNGVDAPSDSPAPQASRPRNEVAFVGNLHSLPNFDAVRFFAADVMPIIHARRPDVVFRIIGPSTPGVARQLARYPGARVEGFAPSLEQALESARVGVCPVRVGAGIQNKVLNYFSNRLAVVCSPVGLEGLKARAGRHLLLAHSAREWAQAVLYLLENERLAQRLADAGRALAVREYRWDQRVEPLQSRLERLLGGPSPEFAPDLEPFLLPLSAGQRLQC